MWLMSPPIRRQAALPAAFAAFRTGWSSPPRRLGGPHSAWLPPRGDSVRCLPYVGTMADQLSTQAAERVGVPGYPGPFGVGRYATRLRDEVRRFARVCVIGEVTGARLGRGPNVYFELRDADGALPCAMWR